MRTLTVVQARTGSTRLPGKVLEQIGGRTMLEWVLHRAEWAGLGDVIVATTTDKADDPVARLATRNGFGCHRGSPDDVLERFYDAACWWDADQIVRVTADCPLLCPQLLVRTVDLLEHVGVDYTAVIGAPTGFGQEAFTMGLLQAAYQEAADPSEREHVVPWMLARPDRFKLGYVTARPLLRKHSGWDLSVDTPADLALIRRLFESTDGGLFDLDSRQILGVVEADSALLEMVA